MGEIDKLFVKIDVDAREFDQTIKKIIGRKVYDPRRSAALTREPISGPAERRGDEAFYPTIGYRWRFCWKTYLRNLWRALRGG